MTKPLTWVHSSGERWHAPLLLAMCSFTLFASLGQTRLWDRDEPRNARCASEMLAHDDWIVPTFNGELRTHKPIMLYWLMMSAYTIAGESETTARIGSALLALGTVGLTYAIGRRLIDSRVALWGGIILGSSLMFIVAGRAATPDSCLIFFGTAAIWIAVRSWPIEDWRATDLPFVSGARWSRWSAIGVGSMMGLAVLAKGPVGFVLPMTILAATAWRLRPETHSRLNWRHFRDVIGIFRPVWLVAALLSVSVPWYAAVGYATGGRWVDEFLFQHNVGRAMQPMEGHDGSGFVYYPLAMLAGFFPWSVWTIPVVLWWRQRRRSNPPTMASALLLSWVAVYVLVFSMAQTKLPNYVTPAYPALALWVAHFLVHGVPSPTAVIRGWMRASSWVVTLVGCGLLIALPWFASQSLSGDTWLGAVGLVLIAGGVACERSIASQKYRQAIQRFGLAAVAFSTCLFAFAAPRVSRHQHFGELLHVAQERGGSIASFVVHEPSWVFYARRTIPFLTADETIRAQRQLRQGGLLITSRGALNQFAEGPPTDWEVIHRVPYFLRNDELLLIAHRTELASQADRSHEKQTSGRIGYTELGHR